MDAIQNNILQNLGQSTPPKSKKELGQEDFLKLLVTQMNHQNPLDPQDSGAFLAQMAQFCAVDGIQNMERSLSGLSTTLQSNQALQASALVGRSVSVPADSINLASAKKLEGMVKLDQSTADLKISIFDSKGFLIKQLNLGPQAVGDVAFSYNAQPGEYKIHAQALQGTHAISVPTQLMANVESVSLGKTNPELTLNVSGIGAKSLSDINKIHQ